MKSYKYKENYIALLELPIVKKLVRKNEKLQKENASLKNLIYSLPEFRRDSCNCCSTTITLPSKVNIKKEPRTVVDLTGDDNENITYSFPENSERIVPKNYIVRIVRLCSE
jgi:hypothetical protein